jgi:hypothetical protein
MTDRLIPYGRVCTGTCVADVINLRVMARLCECCKCKASHPTDIITMIGHLLAKGVLIAKTMLRVLLAEADVRFDIFMYIKSI